MPVGNIVRTASALRTALVGRPMVRFDAPSLIGPVPEAGRMVEEVEARGRHLEVVWDDGIVLDTHLKGRSEWHLYRQGDPWQRSWEALRASIQTEEWVAVCFDAPSVETYRLPDRRRHPGFGRLGPDLRALDADLAESVDLLLSYPEPETRLRDVLVDDHVMQGVGNVLRCEVLWATELSPWAHVGDVSHHDAVLIVNTAARLVRQRVGAGSTERPTRGGLAVYGRRGQACLRCHDSIESRPVGRHGRTIYWCPGCQVRLDRRLSDPTPVMDPHPAAVKYLNDLPWRSADGW